MFFRIYYKVIDKWLTILRQQRESYDRYACELVNMILYGKLFHIQSRLIGLLNTWNCYHAFDKVISYHRDNEKSLTKISMCRLCIRNESLLKYPYRFTSDQPIPRTSNLRFFFVAGFIFAKSRICTKRWDRASSTSKFRSRNTISSDDVLGRARFPLYEDGRDRKRCKVVPRIPSEQPLVNMHGASWICIVRGAYAPIRRAARLCRYTLRPWQVSSTGRHEIWQPRLCP